MHDSHHVRYATMHNAHHISPNQIYYCEYSFILILNLGTTQMSIQSKTIEQEEKILMIKSMYNKCDTFYILKGNMVDGTWMESKEDGRSFS